MRKEDLFPFSITALSAEWTAKNLQAVSGIWGSSYGQIKHHLLGITIGSDLNIRDDREILQTVRSQVRIRRRIIGGYTVIVQINAQ